MISNSLTTQPRNYGARPKQSDHGDRHVSRINRDGEWVTPSHINRDGEYVPDLHIGRNGDWIA